MSLQLRGYQSGSLDGLRRGFAAGYRSQMLYAPTGAGKTEMAIALLDATNKKGNRAAMILDRIILCDQTSQRLEKYKICLLYTSPSPRDRQKSRMPSSA